MKYRITNKVLHTEIAEVEAESVKDAYIQAIYAHFTPQNDDGIIDQDCEEIND